MLGDARPPPAGAPGSLHSPPMPSDGDRTDAATDAATADLRADVDRLRAMIGPDEQLYDDLRDELARARDAVRDAEAEAGRLRGTITEMRLDLHRARQDQFHLQRVALRPVSGLVGRLRRLRHHDP